jgi:protein serine kinase H
MVAVVEEPASPGAARCAKDEADRVWSGGLVSIDLGLTMPRVLVEKPYGQQHTDFRLRRKLSVCSPKSDVKMEDHYSVTSTFGTGGFAVVRDGMHIPTKSPCCIKVIRKTTAGKAYRDHVVEAGAYEMLMTMSRKTPHPCVVKYLDFIESQSCYYVVMERLQGCELTVALTDTDAPRWTERRCAGVMIDLLSALNHIHDFVGVMHRDVKLENLMYRGRTKGAMSARKLDGSVVLIDFGLSRFVDQPWDGRRDGTPLYTAPEVIAEWKAPQRTDGYFTPAVDCWAAGLILYILLTGCVPFGEEDVEAGLAGEKAETSIKALEVKRASDGLSTPALLRGLLQPDPRKRLSSAEAITDTWLEFAAEVHTLKPQETYDYAVQISKSSMECARLTQ